MAGKKTIRSNVTSKNLTYARHAKLTNFSHFLRKSANRLEESADEDQGGRARICFLLSECLKLSEKSNEVEEGLRLRQEAFDIFKKMRPDHTSQPSMADFDNLVPSTVR